MEVRREDWDDAKTTDMRDRLAKEITELSIAWKKDRAEKQAKKGAETSDSLAVQEVASSDSDVDIISATTTQTPAKGKGKGKRIAPTKGGRATS